jgi:hypothetical protein
MYIDDLAGSLETAVIKNSYVCSQAIPVCCKLAGEK